MSDDLQIQEEFTDWMNGLSDAEHLIVIQRACIEAGYEHKLKPEGGLVIAGDTQDPDFLSAIHTQYKYKFVQEALDALTEKGLVKPDGVNGDGEVVYRVSGVLDEG